MSKEKDYGNDFISISDEDGNTYELEHIDTLEIDGEFYLAFLPADIDEDDDDYGLVILKMIEDDDGEEATFVVPDEDIIDELHERFIESLSSDDN